MKFIENHTAKLFDELTAMFAEASAVYIAVAFVRSSGVALLAEPISEAINRGVSVSLMFGLDFALSQPQAIRRLGALGVATRFYSSRDAFHPKGYIFQIGASTRAMVGSSNLSASGLTSGREWNVVIEPADAVLAEFLRLWTSEHVSPVTEHALAHLEAEQQVTDLEALVEKEDLAIITNTPDEIPGGVWVRAPTGAAIQFSFEMNQSFKT
jgi:hypothetical protein